MHDLVHGWGETLARFLAGVPQLAAAWGLGAWPVGAVALLAGVALLFTGIRLGPLLSALAGAVVTWVVASRHAALGGPLGIPPAAAVWTATAFAGFACAFVPVLYPVLLGALPGAAWGMTIPIAGHAWLGAAAAAAAFGGLCFLARRLVFALTAAIPGALLIDAGLLVLAGHVPALASLTSRPTAFVAVTAVLVVAGTAAQLSSQPSSASGHGRGDERARRGRRVDT